jgi:hypothetical protein
MRRFWQKQRTVAVKGILSYFAGESTATKPAKPACIERQRQIKQKNSYKRNASTRYPKNIKIFSLTAWYII